MRLGSSLCPLALTITSFRVHTCLKFLRRNCERVAPAHCDGGERRCALCIRTCLSSLGCVTAHAVLSIFLCISARWSLGRQDSTLHSMGMVGCLWWKHAGSMHSLGINTRCGSHARLSTHRSVQGWTLIVGRLQLVPACRLTARCFPCVHSHGHVTRRVSTVVQLVLAMSVRRACSQGVCMGTNVTADGQTASCCKERRHCQFASSCYFNCGCRTVLSMTMKWCAMDTHGMAGHGSHETNNAQTPHLGVALMLQACRKHSLRLFGWISWVLLRVDVSAGITGARRTPSCNDAPRRRDGKGAAVAVHYRGIMAAKARQGVHRACAALATRLLHSNTCNPCICTLVHWSLRRETSEHSWVLPVPLHNMPAAHTASQAFHKRRAEARAAAVLPSHGQRRLRCH